MLRLSEEALVVSLLRHGLAVTVSGLYEQLFNRLDTCVLNVLPRRVLVLGRIDRLPVLHATAGVLLRAICYFGVVQSR